MKTRPNSSFWLSISIFVVFVTLFLSTGSPFVTILPVLYGASFLLSPRFARDSANIWGARLLVYAGMALLGRTPTGASRFFFEAQVFATVGLVFGGEILLQAFREPPKNLKFDPSLILLSGVLFLLASNSRAPHLWICAPLYILTTLLALGDLRLQAQPRRFRASLWRGALVLTTVALGFGLHTVLFQNQGTIMSLGAQLLSNHSSNYQGNAVSDSPRLESTFGGNTSTARLMRIQGSLSDSHLRGGAFSLYKTGQWGPPLSDVTARPITPALPAETRESLPVSPNSRILSTEYRTDIDARITVLRETGGIVYAPLNVTALVPITVGDFDWNRFAGPLKVTDPAPVTYGIVEAKDDIDGIQITQGPLCVAPSGASVTPEQEAELLEIPAEIDPRVKQLALEITLEAPTQAEKIAAIGDYLLKNHKYSLNFSVGADDPVSQFLLEKKAAHCQFFGSAATILMRLNGIPARYVTGFWAHETAPDGTTIVRGRDAHAWSEAFVSGIGWVTVETTPPAGRADPAVKPLPWYQKTIETIEDTFARVRAWFGNLTQWQIAGLVALAFCIWGAERWRQARKIARRQPSGPIIPADLQPLAQNFERILARRGLVLAAQKPWSEAIPNDWQAAQKWVDNYNQARFGSQKLSLEKLTRDLKALEKAPKNTK